MSSDIDTEAMTTTAENILEVADELDQAGPEVPVVGFMSLPDAVYFADPCERPSLTQSLAHKLLTSSPLHAWHFHPRLGRGRRSSTSSQTRGSLLHALLLGGVELVELPFKDFRTTKAKDRRDEVKRGGDIPVLKAELAAAKEAAAIIRGRLEEDGVRLGAPAQCEWGIFWESVTSDGELVQCRGKLDQLELVDGGAIITDLKMTRNAHLSAIERSVDSYGYAIQAAAYIEAVTAVFPELAGRVRYRWAFAEPEQPYATHVAEPDGELLQLGERRWGRAVDIWGECTRTNHWPGYGSSRVRALPWAIQRELETEASS